MNSIRKVTSSSTTDSITAGPRGEQGERGPQGETGPQGDQAQWVAVTQSEYDLLTPDPSILYLIVEA